MLRRGGAKWDRANRSCTPGSTPPDPARHPRLALLPLAEAALGREIRGNVIDLGAGSGYAGAWLAANRDVRVTALELTREAVETNIPATARSLGVEDRVEPVQGSFEDLSAFEARFDWAVSFGALHHAPDLHAALRNVHRCLVPGGALILQEPYAPDATSNDAYRRVYDASEIFAGERIRHGDRHDHFYRKCEWWTALHFCDFQVLHERDVRRELAPRGAWKRLRRLAGRWRRRSKEAPDPSDPTPFPRLRAEMLRPTPWLALCRRPERPSREVPHRWDGLNRQPG